MQILLAAAGPMPRFDFFVTKIGRIFGCHVLTLFLCVVSCGLADSQLIPIKTTANYALSRTEASFQAEDARGQTVMLDAWFKSQLRKNAAGQTEYFHYKWNDVSDSGFSLLGQIFQSYGVALDTLYSAPTVKNLKRAQYSILVSPDIPVKNPHPNYVQPEDAEQVAGWVREGGVLILMENDPANADIEHLNLIADPFGIHFNSVLSHHVIGDDFAAGQIA